MLSGQALRLVFVYAIVYHQNNKLGMEGIIGAYTTGISDAKEARVVTVLSYRCAYCGGCVSVCPVEALSLAETRLVISSDCIDCGNCVTACPVGALQPDSAKRTGHPTRLQHRYDLVVVGAGPGGSTAARVAA